MSAEKSDYVIEEWNAQQQQWIASSKHKSPLPFEKTKEVLSELNRVAGGKQLRMVKA
jgi:hypothetical protein